MSKSRVFCILFFIVLFFFFLEIRCGDELIVFRVPSSCERLYCGERMCAIGSIADVYVSIVLLRIMYASAPGGTHL